jgi:hypothetical protein
MVAIPDTLLFGLILQQSGGDIKVLIASSQRGVFSAECFLLNE